MKFTDGCWLVRPGMHPMHPAQAYDIWVGDDTMTVYAPTSRIRTRHDTLNRPVVTVTYSSHVGIGGISCDHGAHYVHELLSLGVGEQVDGLGERFGAFVKYGQAVD